MFQAAQETLKRRALINLILILGSSIFLPACALDAEPTPVGQLQTFVAATLTAQPTQTPPPSPTAAATETEIAPSPVSDPRLKPTPTLPPDDPRQSLDLTTPDYIDDFSAPFKWGEWANESGSILRKDNRLEAVDRIPDPFIGWSTTNILGGNIFVEVLVELGECSGKDASGVGIRIDRTASTSGYTLEFSCDGHYRMRKFRKGVVEILQDWIPSSSINIGGGSRNRLGIAALNNQLHIIANGQRIDKLEDKSYLTGNFALFANAVETPGLVAYFDDFQIWYIQP
jgi:hypothetical protein